MDDIRVSSAINGNMVTVSHNRIFLSYANCFSDVLTTIMRKRVDIFSELETHLERLGGIKWYIAVCVRFTKFVNQEEVSSTPTFHGKTRILLPTDSVVEQYMEAKDKIMESMAKWISQGSGWTLDKVLRMDLCIVKYQPLYASSYIPTPKKISNSKQGVVNIKNEDNKCFLWSILASIHGPNSSNNYLVGRYRNFEKDINMTGLKYPMKVSEISKFEQLNQTISVNVFGYHNNVYPIRITKEQNRQHHVNLLLLTDKKGNNHYCWIKNISHLLSHLTKHKEQGHYCNYCLHRFTKEETLMKHIPYCKPHGVQKTKLPSETNKWLKFDNYTLCHKVPFTVYADFESFVVPISTCHKDPRTSYTIDTAQHIPSGYCYVIVNHTGKAVKPPTVYTGPNVITSFLDNLLQEAEQHLLPKLRRNVPLRHTPEMEREFEAATVCHLCHKPFPDRNQQQQDKVANHNHITGEYIGAAHNVCNLNYVVPKHIPVFFHNLQGYDCHHLMQGIGKYKKQKMSCIAKSSERYISVTLASLRFLDSLQFLNYSLEKLVSNLATDGTEHFKILQQCMGEGGETDNHHLDLLLRKGVFPYTWMTGPEKLDATCLPPKTAFYNDLTRTAISDEEYKYAQQIWTTFNMRTMRDYHNLYLKTDVLLLADVFENFRETSLKYYEIDPCNCYSSPGLAWQAMLKMTGVKLDLLTDIDQHLFVESGIRGCVAMIPHRFAVANNKYLQNDFNKSQPSQYLLYLDCNNLYGTAMSQPLPQSNFKWLTEEEIHGFDATTVPDDHPLGFILEVDLEYPPRVHDIHSDYPLAPEKSVVRWDMLSPYVKRLCDEIHVRPTNMEKLLTTVDNKRHYTIHYRTLKLYLELGLRITKIHRVLSFSQSAWLAPFIHFNTQKRQAARNNFEKDYFKLMNNAVYGKSIENVRSRIDFKLITTEKKLLKWTASPRLTNFFAFTKDLAGLTLKKATVLLNKPVYVGLTVLDLSKLVMYDFHYNWTVRKYGQNAKLCMTDTDSLFYSIKTDDIYADMKQDIDLFDTSDYPTDHPLYSVRNKKVLGKFKDQLNGRPPKEIAGLRAKCYSILEDNDEEKRVAKGVARVAIKQELKHRQYKDCLFDHIKKLITAVNIQSTRHQIVTKFLSKLALSPYDDKRYIMEDGIRTLPYGHYKIPSSTPSKRRFVHDEGKYDEPPSKKSNLENLASMLCSSNSNFNEED